MPTAFRTTATLPDFTGRFRTSIILASRHNGEWSQESIARQIEMERLPCKALTLTNEEYDAMEANSDLRFGYVDKPGDTESPFNPENWTKYTRC
jgi:hypothetical protein